MVPKRSFVNWLKHSLYQLDSAEGGGTRLHKKAPPRSAYIAPSLDFTNLIVFVYAIQATPPVALHKLSNSPTVLVVLLCILPCQ